MRPPARIRSWLTIEKMFHWLQSAPDKDAYKRRMAVWLTHTGNIHAAKVAEILDVSVQAVWLWINQYNKLGPSGLQRRGRGGRRREFMTRKQEAELLSPIIHSTRAGHPPGTASIKQSVEAQLGRKVSKSYIYKLLARHGWARIIALSSPAKPPPDKSVTFEKLSKPWLRSD